MGAGGMAEQIRPELGNPTLLYAIQDEALTISKGIGSNELSVAYIGLAHIAGYIALYLETQDLGHLLDIERERNIALQKMLSEIHAELIKLKDTNASG